MVFTVFGALPHFDMALLFHYLFSKFPPQFSLLFSTIFHSKIDKNRVQEPTSQKIRFGTSFFTFFIDFGAPFGGPWGAKIPLKWATPFEVFAFVFFWPLLGFCLKKIAFLPPWTPQSRRANDCYSFFVGIFPLFFRPLFPFKNRPPLG